MNNLVNVQKLVDDQLLFIKEPMDEEALRQILNFNNLAYQLFEDATKAMFKRDYNDAEALDSKTSKLRETGKRPHQAYEQQENGPQHLARF